MSQLQQAFQVKFLGPPEGPPRRLRMMNLGSADYDTWQIYFPPCSKKILEKKIFALMQSPKLKS